LYNSLEVLWRLVKKHIQFYGNYSISLSWLLKLTFEGKDRIY